MKLWLIKPIEVLQDGPWDPWFDKAFGFVVRAETEEGARHIANDHAGDENWNDQKPWLSAEHSSCVELTADGEAELVLRDLQSA